MENKQLTPILFPFEPAKFWLQIRKIIQEERAKGATENTHVPLMEKPGLAQKFLYKIREVCTLFCVSRPTIYEWVRHGKLKPFKIRSRVYFLASYIQRLLPS